MKTRKMILNDNDKPMTKTQAKKLADVFILEQVHHSWDNGDNEAGVDFDEMVEVEGEIALRDLLEICSH